MRQEVEIEMDLSMYNSAGYMNILSSVNHSKNSIFNPINRSLVYQFTTNFIYHYNLVNKDLLSILRPYYEVESLPKLYHYNPRLYSFHKYGTTDLWDVILTINNMTNFDDFKTSRVRYINHNGIQELFIFLMKYNNLPREVREKKIDEDLVLFKNRY